MEEQSKKFAMPSGAELAVTVAPFADAMALLKASLATLKGIKLDKESLEQEIKTLKDLSKSPSAMSMLVERVVSFATSDAVESSLFRCFQRTTYTPPGGAPQKVAPGLFDHPEHGGAAREDYAQMVASVLEVNCAPFLVKALSGFAGQKTAESSGAQSAGSR